MQDASQHEYPVEFVLSHKRKISGKASYQCQACCPALANSQPKISSLFWYPVAGQSNSVSDQPDFGCKIKGRIILLTGYPGSSQVFSTNSSNVRREENFAAKLEQNVKGSVSDPYYWIRIRIRPKIWIRIRIRPKIWIRIRIQIRKTPASGSG